MSEFFAEIISGWYLENQRDLPWRSTKDPFKIWLSEIILQQTRVDQGLSYYMKFTSEFDTVKSLSEAPEEKIMKFWQGLGYYSRARNLHFSAKYIVNELNGRFPTTYKELLKLKGVGHYTAAAIASFCFDEKIAVLDGNVFRVLSRVFGVSDPINTLVGEKKFKELTQKLLPKKNVANYNQGIMEFGALQCIPVSPNCSDCVLKSHCYATKNDVVSELPVKLKKTKVKEMYIHFLLVQNEDSIYLTKREKKGIWQHLWEFPNLTYDAEVDMEQLLSDVSEMTNSKRPSLLKSSGVQKHLLSHRKIYARFHQVKLSSGISDGLGDLVRKSKLDTYPIHRLMDRFLEENPDFLRE